MTSVLARYALLFTGGRVGATAPLLDSPEERYLTSVRGGQRNLIAAAGGLAVGRMVFADMNKIAAQSVLRQIDRKSTFAIHRYKLDRIQHLLGRLIFLGLMEVDP